MYDQLIEEFYLAQSDGRSVAVVAAANHASEPRMELRITPMKNHVFGIVSYGGNGTHEHLPTFVFGPDKAVAWLKTKIEGKPAVHGTCMQWDEVRALLLRKSAKQEVR
jgi:hypothetical protein